MMEGNWITMPGVPLITAGGPEAAAREEGEVTGVPGDEAGTAEDTTAPTTEEGNAEGALEPATEVKRTEAAERTAPPASGATEAAPVPEVESAPAQGDVVAATATIEEDSAADASEAAHVAELEAALLAASSPGDEAPAEPAADAAVASVEAPDAAPRQVKPPSSLKELRSEARQAGPCKQTKRAPSGVMNFCKGN
jgi:hypothetical protein